MSDDGIRLYDTAVGRLLAFNFGQSASANAGESSKGKIAPGKHGKPGARRHLLGLAGGGR